MKDTILLDCEGWMYCNKVSTVCEGPRSSEVLGLFGKYKRSKSKLDTKMHG